MEGLVIGAAFVVAVYYFSANTANSQRFLLHALLTVSLQIFLLMFVRLKQLSHLDDQRVRAFNVEIDVLSLIALFSELSPLDQVLLLLNGIDDGLNERIGGDVAASLPYSDIRTAVDNITVL